MELSRLRPVPDRPILELLPPGTRRGGALLVADLHLGLGATEASHEGPPEGSAERMVEELLTVAESTSASSVLVAGDTKHPIMGTPPRLRPVVFRFFSTLLQAGLTVEIVLGNHDVGLARFLPREVVVHPPEGIVRHGVGIFHGHRWPSNRVLRSPRLVTGHLHPGFRFAPTPESPTGKTRCWVRVQFPPPVRRPRRRRRHAPLEARALVVLPAFNPLAGIESLNRTRPSRGRSFLYHRFLDLGEARAFLLDGTDLGTLVTSRSVPRPSKGRVASPDQ